MGNVTSSKLFGITFLAVSALFSQLSLGQDSGATESATHSTPPQDTTKALTLEEQDKIAKKNHHLRPLVHDLGRDCFEYDLDVVTLKDSSHQMFWKQDDCIRIHVTNNPFLFKWKIETPETLIKEDDPLSAFGGKFGLNVSAVSDSGGAKDNNTSDKSKAASEQQDKLTSNTADAMSALNDLAIDNKKKNALKSDLFTLDQIAIPSHFALLSQQKTDALNDATKQLGTANLAEPTKQDIVAKFEKVREAAAPAPPTRDQIDNWKSRAMELQSEATQIQKTEEEKKASYAAFSVEAPKRLEGLADPTASAEQIRARAEELRAVATGEINKLSDGELDSIAKSSKFENQLTAFARKAAPLHDELTQALLAGGKPVDDILQLLHEAGQTVAYTACSYKAELDNDFESIRTGILDPLNKVLAEPLVFGFIVGGAAVKREGPFGDPTQVMMTLRRDAVSPFIANADSPKTPANTKTAFTCSSDPSILFAHGAKYEKLDDFFSDKPKDPETDTYTRNSNAPKKTGDTTTAAAAKQNNAPAADPDANLVLKQPWFFGRARLVLTGGLSSGFLGKQEFQRSSSIAGSGSGATSSTVIGLKTDTRFRFTPMLYGHTLLYSGRHDSDAWYATLGVTANSDNKGTDPEFLLGFSRSFVQQRFFATVGAYLGERQKLDGGLHVGDTIPSTLTGELPVTKSYHAGWGFGISYRFASTKDPQKSSAAPAKQTAGK
jgi:hypothetical protein